MGAWNENDSGDWRSRLEERVDLTLPVVLRDEQRKLDIYTTTTNLCAQGFYCVVPEPISEAGLYHCVIEISSKKGKTAPVYLVCRIKVVWSQRCLTGGYGANCCIEEYLPVR